MQIIDSFPMTPNVIQCQLLYTQCLPMTPNVFQCQLLSAYVSGWLVVFPYIRVVVGFDVSPSIYRCYWFRGSRGHFLGEVGSYRSGGYWLLHCEVWLRLFFKNEKSLLARSIIPRRTIAISTTPFSRQALPI